MAYLMKQQLLNGVSLQPFGLIESNWGGTRIEPWTTPEGLASCEVPAFEDPNHPETSNSFLYNAMIHPIIKFTIKGAIWYQGTVAPNQLWPGACTIKL